MRKKKERFGSDGIYFLLNRGRVVYVGQTTRWPSRLAGHIYKNFNEVRFIPCRPSKLWHYEGRWIRKFKPELNKNQSGNYCRMYKFV